MDTVAHVVGFGLLLLAAGYAVGWILGLNYGLISTATSKLRTFWNDHERGPKRRGAREIDGGSVVTLLHELSRRANIPAPRLYFIDSPYANANATGRNYRHSSICVTTGLLNGLGCDELAGVLSHELAHVLQRSTLTNTVVATVSAALSLLPFAGPFVGLGIVRSLILVFIVPVVAFLIQLGVSRANEYAADRGGARLTGRPDALASALSIVSAGDPEGVGDTVDSPLGKVIWMFGKRLVGPRADNPFSPYPRPANRIAALRRLPPGVDD